MKFHQTYDLKNNNSQPQQHACVLILGHLPKPSSLLHMVIKEVILWCVETPCQLLSNNDIYAQCLKHG